MNVNLTTTGGFGYPPTPSKFSVTPGKSLGWVKDPEDDRDYEPTFETAVADLPEEFLPSLAAEFRAPNLGAIVNQNGYPRCVTYSGSTIAQHLNIEDQALKRSLVLGIDEDEWYAECKNRDGYPGDGTYIRVAAQITVERGYLVRKIDAYNNYPEVPEQHRKFGSYHRLNSLDQIRQAVYDNGPVWFGILVDDGIYEPTSTNPRLPEPNGRVVGGHAMCVVGYSTSAKGFWVKNSWGQFWGRGGYCRYPYTHFEEYSGWDAWMCLP